MAVKLYFVACQAPDFDLDLLVETAGGPADAAALWAGWVAEGPGVAVVTDVKDQPLFVYEIKREGTRGVIGWPAPELELTVRDAVP